MPHSTEESGISPFKLPQALTTRLKVVSGYEKVEFKAVDGVILRGWLYRTAGQAPIIIMTPGKILPQFNCVKEMLLPDVAEWFQKYGFHALIYDPRSIGDSDGAPRNQIDPLQQAEDLSDIITHVAALSGIDASRMFLWGMSFGGTVSACAAAVDRRVKGLVMVCPILRFYAAEKRDKAFALLIKDRQSQLRGNEPLTLAPFNNKGENPIGMAGSGGLGGLEAYQFMNASYHKLAMWRPRELLQDMLDTTPVMVITPELDTMSAPEEQKTLFDQFRQPKEFVLAKGKGHLTVLSGEGSEDLLQAQANFLKAAVDGTWKRQKIHVNQADLPKLEVVAPKSFGRQTTIHTAIRLFFLGPAFVSGIAGELIPSNVMAPTIVLITGANRGIGRGLLELYLARPYHIVIATVRAPTTALETELASLPKAGGTSLIVVKLDLNVPSDPATAIKELSSVHGINHIDILVANAGIALKWVKVSEVTQNDIQQHVDVNVHGFIHLAQAFLPVLQKAKDPKWVTIGSSAAYLT
ncbi:hypothetical protein VTI74DRAFT_5752 [Chaetomium olivicolor]